MIQQLLDLFRRFFEPVSAAAVSAITSTSTAPGTALAQANGARKGLAVYNDSTAILYLKYGSGPTSTLYTVQLASQSYWEMPIGAGPYTGQVAGIWAAANGFAYVTEW